LADIFPLRQGPHFNDYLDGLESQTAGAGMTVVGFCSPLPQD
jgi:hypothetical protein